MKQCAMRYDLVIKDGWVNTVAPGMPEIVRDLPARARQRARGISTTVVNGEALLRDGKGTGAPPRRLLRGPLTQRPWTPPTRDGPEVASARSRIRHARRWEAITHASGCSSRPVPLVRIVAWNIRAGGGRRGEALAAQLRRWRPDVAALCEFRATPPSLALAQALADLGLRHQLSTASQAAPSANRLLVASRWPLDRIRDRRAPSEPGLWLLARVGASRPFALGAMHVPNRVTGRKWPFLDAVLTVAERWRGGPALLLGDTNSGRPGIDEESPAFNEREGSWLEALERAGWRDAFRHLRGTARAYTWYSPNAGNGFRLDQAFLNPGLLPSLAAARYAWGRREPARGHTAALSDHAALLLDLRNV